MGEVRGEREAYPSWNSVSSDDKRTICNRDLRGRVVLQLRVAIVAWLIPQLKRSKLLHKLRVLIEWKDR